MIFFKKKVKSNPESQNPSTQAQYESSRSGMWYGQKWEGGLASRNPFITIDHDKLRNQGRVLAQTNLQARAIVDRDIDITVDSGLVLAPEPKYNILGISAEEADSISSQISDAFDLWAQSKNSTRSGARNFYQSQRLMRKYLSRDGECFVRQYYSEDSNLVSPLQFEIIDPDQIRGSGYTSTLNHYLADDGIIRDASGMAIAYKIQKPFPQFGFVTIPRIGPDSGRTLMTHGFDAEFSGQTRGFSSLGVSVQELELLADFTLASAKKATNQANIYMVGESSNGPVVNPFAGIGTNGAGPAGSKGYAPSGNPHLSPLYSKISEVTVKTPGSIGIFNAPEGQTLKPFASTAPSDSYNSFVDNVFGYIAAAHGSSIEMILMKFSHNFAALRGTLILVWRAAVNRRYQLACHLLDPLYESWLAEEIASGRFRCPGWQNPRIRAAWLAHRWIGPSMPNVDPLKTINAAKSAAELGAVTLSDISREFNDSDAKNNRSKLRGEFEDLPCAPWIKTSPNQTEEEEEDDK